MQTNRPCYLQTIFLRVPLLFRPPEPGRYLVSDPPVCPRVRLLNIPAYPPPAFALSPVKRYGIYQLTGI